MLNSIQLYGRSHQKAFSKGWRFLWHKPMIGCMTLFIIAWMFFLPALLWLITENIDGLTKQWKQSGHMLMYLKQPMDEEQQREVLSQIKKIPGVAKAVLTTPAEGLVALEQQAGMAELGTYLTDNPLPAVIEVTPSAEQLQTASAVKLFYQTLAQHFAVEQVQFDQDWMQKVYTGVGLFSHLVMLLTVLLGMLSILVINYTLRFVLLEKRDEICVYTLVGAPFAYILRPFLYSGMLYALIGFCLAIVFLQGVTHYLTINLAQWMQTYHINYCFTDFSLQKYLIFLILALFLGWVGARLAVARKIVFLDAL